ncbi:MAG: dynamin family protein, partial [Synergistaceae bacterium]|nr:dynamin family protein [Synergistaceae bacterium]
METLSRKLKTSSIILNKAGGNFTKHAERMLQLADQLDKDRLNLAVLGQFKRGKSTLVNALLKARFLPTAVLPLTAVPTEIFYGIGRSVRISFTDNSSQKQIFNDDASMSLYLNDYVTEEENPCNIKNVKKVEIEYPSDFLSKGIVLIDTPGTGSTYKHNTDTTMEFIDQCDAALF